MDAFCPAASPTPLRSSSITWNCCSFDAWMTPRNILAEKKAHRTGKSEGVIFRPDQQDLRVVAVQERRTRRHKIRRSAAKVSHSSRLGGDGLTYGAYMKDARFTILTPQLLSRVVDMFDDPDGRPGHQW